MPLSAGPQPAGGTPRSSTHCLVDFPPRETCRWSPLGLVIKVVLSYSSLIGVRPPQKRGDRSPFRCSALRWAATRDPARGLAGCMAFDIGVPGFPFLSMASVQPSNPTETWRQYHRPAPMMPDPHPFCVDHLSFRACLGDSHASWGEVVGLWVIGASGPSWVLSSSKHFSSRPRRDSSRAFPPLLAHIPAFVPERDRGTSQPSGFAHAYTDRQRANRPSFLVY